LEIFFGNFFWCILGLCTPSLLFKNLKKLSLGWEGPF
jgi:hypothetical protein